MKIYSKIQHGLLLHQIIDIDTINGARTNLCNDEDFLQCALLRLPIGTTFKPHRHIPKHIAYVRPDESWFIISGMATIIMYDIDGTYLEEHELKQGQISFTFNGAGHNYKVLTDDFVCAEYKVGPYFGVEKDKIFI